MTDDIPLLKQFVEEHSEEAFAELVHRHVNLVYSAALRQVGGDAHLAWDAAQGVFLALAQNARRLVHHAALTGWLYTTTRFVSAKLVRTRQRTREREQAAFTMNDILGAGADEPDWSAVRPLLDAAMHELRAADREAVLLRNFEGRSFSDIGRLWGLGENAARMRVERAMEKLRTRLARRGITSTAAALGAALTTHAVGSAPIGLAGAGATLAFAASTGAVGVAGTLASLQFMSAPMFKAAAAAVVVVAVGGVYLGSRSARTTSQRPDSPAPRSMQAFAATADRPASTKDNAVKAAPSANPDNPKRRNSASEDALEASVKAAAQKAMAASARASLDQRYGGLFRRLKLTPTELEKFRDLLTERELSRFDAMAVAQEHGINLFGNPEEFKTAIERVRSEVDQSIHAFLGDARYAVFQDYNTHAPAQFLFDTIERRLSYTSTPLHESQAEPLLGILTDAMSAAPSDPASGNDPLTHIAQAVASGDPSAATLTHGPISDDTLARAQSVLSPPQIEILRQIQMEQRDQVSALKALGRWPPGVATDPPKGDAGVKSSNNPRP